MSPIALAATPTPSHLLSVTHAQVSVDKLTEVVQRNIGNYQGYDSVHWYVGNAKQAASFYVTRMGFERVAYRGLETGSRLVASHVVRNGNITFVLTSPLLSPDSPKLSNEDRKMITQIQDHLKQHGDAVCDVAFEVDNVRAVYDAAVRRGAHSVSPPTIMTDEFGTVVCACIKTYGDTSRCGRSNFYGLPRVG